MMTANKDRIKKTMVDRITVTKTRIETIVLKGKNGLGEHFLLMIMISLISSCGFHLRGDIVLPALYERVHIITVGNAVVSKPLAQALTNIGSQMVNSPEGATAVLTLLSAGTQRKALNVGGGTIREYELQLNVSFVVQNSKGVQLADNQTISVIRNFRNNVNDVLAKDNEEQVIRQEMIQPAVFQILRRMKAIAQ
jgi:LPS-assembly lipoprotein